MKNIEVLGVKVQDASLRESLKISDGYLRNGALNTIIYLSSKLLVDAGSNEEQKNWIEKSDLTIYGDSTILKNIGSAEHRIKEVQEDVYLSEFLKKIVRMRRSVFLLADTNERLSSLRKELTDYQENLNIIGEYVMDFETVSFDRLMNEMNGYAPNVVISRVSYSEQARIMEESRKYLNANIWLGLLDHPAGVRTHRTGFTKMMRIFYKWIFCLDFRRKQK